ncbi:MAG TPA: efflux transporter outer membrane subunit [Phenylobacterium sp.]|nr:efflux transporter outer membrane subunit [Phenylobacterium sp.]
MATYLSERGQVVRDADFIDSPTHVGAASLKMASSRLVLSLTLLGLCAGCAAGPDYRAPSASELKVPQQFSTPVAVSPQADLARWWRAFDDPALTALVERGLAANLDVDRAGARLRQARASLAAARGGLLPSLGASARGSATEDRTSYQAGFDAAYEVDVFGGVRRSVEAARASAQGAEASLHSVQLSIAAEIALNYLDARRAQTRLRIARESLAYLDDTVEIVGWRVQAGLVGSRDLEQARQLRAQTAAGVPTQQATYAAAANRLAVLLGEPPGAVEALLVPPTASPAAPAVFPAAIPAEVVRRRPDVALAERTLAAETARIGVEQAQLYPALALSGSFAGSGGSLSAAADNAVGSLVAALTAPIFRGGRIRAAVEGQRASTAAALSSYRLTVLTALEDVENALVAVDAAERRETSLVAADAAARNSADLARLQYRTGLTDFQSLLESERTLLSSQDSLASARADRAVAAVQLYKALGGGWQAAPPPSSITAP